MKKINNKFLIGLIILTVFPLAAFADIGVPSIATFKVIVTNPNGISFCTDSKPITIEYNTVLTITAETKVNGNLVYYTNYGGCTDYVYQSDVALETDVVTPDDFEEKKYITDRAPGEFYVYENGAYLYNVMVQVQHLPKLLMK